MKRTAYRGVGILGLKFGVQTVISENIDEKGCKSACVLMKHNI